MLLMVGMTMPYEDLTEKGKSASDIRERVQGDRTGRRTGNGGKLSNS